MMMTEKYYTLPSPFYCSTIYHPSTTNRLDLSKKFSSLSKANNMKLLIDQQPTIQTYSLYDIQERINYFEKKNISDHENENNSKEQTSTTDTLQSVIANTLQQTIFKTESYGSALSRAMMNSATTGQLIGKRRSLSSSHAVSSNDQKRSNRYYSLLSKRVRTYSLTNHSTMAITAQTSFSEEQLTEPQEITSIDYENTYFYPEEATRLDDVLSLTTITSNIQPKLSNTQYDISVCSDTTVFQSDTDEISEGINPIIKQYNDTYPIIPNENIKDNDEQIIQIKLNLTPTDHDFTGVVHAKKCTIVKEKECLSDYDNVNHYRVEEDNKIRSDVDNVSINKLMTSSMQEEPYRRISLDEQLNQQTIVHSLKMNNDIKMITQQQQQQQENDDDGHYSDESNCSDDLKYSSDPARNSCASDDLNNTSSTLRQEAISITRVRCKRRKTWIRSPSSPIQSVTNKPTSYLQKRLQTNLIQPFLSNNQVDETDARQNVSVNSKTSTKTGTSTVLNPTRVKETTSTMLLHNNSLNCDNNNKHKNGEAFSYDFIQSNSNHHSSSLLKTSPTLEKKDISSPKPNKNSNDFHQPSLSPVKRLLNESIDSNIEIIQMDEQECILEIVDGVLTIVPKDKSTSSSSITDNSERKKSSKQRKKRPSSSVASSVSTPSLSEQEQERDELLLSSTSSSKPSSKPFTRIPEILTTKPSSPPPPPSPFQTEQTVDVLDLFSTPINTTNKTSKTLLDESLSSVSSYGDLPNEIKKKPSSIPRSSSPINHKSKSSSIKDSSPTSIENQTRSNKNSLLTQLLQTVKKSSPDDEKEIEKPKSNYSIPKTEPPPAPKPINKARINEFASLLSSSVHLSQPPPTKKPIKQTTKTQSSPTRSDEQSFSSIPSASSDRDERESYHTVKSNNSEQDQTKKHIDARYNERLDDRGSIKIKTANIKALFEQKISDTNKALSQSNEQLLHLSEVRQTHQHRKVPVSYGSLKKNLPVCQPIVSNNNNNTRRKSYHDISTMSKYTDHIAGTKDVVIEDKQPENNSTHHTRRPTAEQIIHPSINSLPNSPVFSPHDQSSESLIAREIRETKEKEDELKRQRKKCGLPEENSTSFNDSMKSESSSSTNLPTKNTSFLSNLDFFSSKLNGSSNESTLTITSPRRSTYPTSNLNHDFSNLSSSNSSRQSSNDELKTLTNVVSQELNRFNENGVPIIRTSSTSGLLHRSSSNQNIISTQNTNNIIQREIEIIRAKEAELRQLGRIQHTSDEHADPRKYQEFVSTLPKSQSINTIPTGKIRRDSENQHLTRHNGPITATTNGFLKPKTNNNNNHHHSSARGKFPNPNPIAPIVSSSNKSIDYSKLSSTDRLELEKRQCQEREQELKKQRNSISVSSSSTNTTINGDSGNVSQEEHDDDQERYFDKIERLKRTENEKAQAPIIRPTKKFDMSQKWEQMVANKIDD